MQLSLRPRGTATWLEAKADQVPRTIANADQDRGNSLVDPIQRSMESGAFTQIRAV